MAAQLEVCEELSFMDWEQPGNRLELHDNRFFNQEIDSVGEIHLNRFVRDGKSDLSANK
jgi:hypothetical protein